MKNILLIFWFLLFANLTTAQVEYKIKYQKSRLSMSSKDFDWSKMGDQAIEFRKLGLQNANPKTQFVSTKELELTYKSNKSSIINTEMYFMNADGEKRPAKGKVIVPTPPIYRDWTTKTIYAFSQEDKLWTLPTGTFDWTIDNSTKLKYLGYELTKATTKSLSGSNIIAWFAEDLPIPEGPSFASGLPGLILIQKSGNTTTKALSVNVIKNSDTTITFPIKTPTINSYEEFKKSNSIGGLAIIKGRKKSK